VSENTIYRCWRDWVICQYCR